MDESKNSSNVYTGEAQSLSGSGKDLASHMGDRAVVGGGPNSVLFDTQLDVKKKKKKEEEVDWLSLDVSEGAVYRPKSRESQEAYDELVLLVTREIGYQPFNILTSACDELLQIIKDSTLTPTQCRAQVADMLGKQSLGDDQFNEMLRIVGGISDYSLGEDSEVVKESEYVGVSVVFDEEDDEEDIMEESWESEQEDGGLMLESGDVYIKPQDTLNLRDIDAYWLKRQLSGFIDDVYTAQDMADGLLDLLSSSKPTRVVENEIVKLLGFQNFSFIKLLLQNRLEVVYCIRLSQCSDHDRELLKQEMEQDPQLTSILDRLYSVNTLVVNKRKVDDLVEKEQVSWSRKYRPSCNLDLDTLKFIEEGHLMSNKEWSLPKGSWKKEHDGYHEIHVPMEHADIKDIKQVSIDSLPLWAQPAFQGVDQLNPLQSRVYECALYSAENILLCAPTGAGKTFVALLTILRELGVHMDRNTGTIDTSSFKMVYIAPMKSLVREMVGNFSRRLDAYNITVAELSGDQNLSTRQLHETNVIVTTPEKWDVITRKGGPSERWFTNLVKLVIFDEIHLLHDSRGPVIENLVSRIIRRIESTREYVRLVGLSATLPNYTDVAVFLRVNPEKGLYVFDNSYRPCPLQQTFIGITSKKPFQQHQMMNRITYETTMKQINDKNQVIVFVHSRKETVLTGKMLLELAENHEALHNIVKEGSAHERLLQSEARNIQNIHLKELVEHGIGVHHAGLGREDRSLVEDLFDDGHLKILCSTATLAWGVNLPAHCVIIKGTQVYNPEKADWTELSMLDVLQMLGRAGRYPRDSFGEGYIITTHTQLKYYMSCLNQQLAVESQFVSRLADSLNAEVVIGSVSNVMEAVDWLQYTYLYVRMLRNRALYQVPIDDDKLLVQHCINLIHSAARLLSKAQLITYDEATGTFTCSELGRISSHYYISHVSISTYNKHLLHDLSLIDILHVFTLSEEFKYVSIRRQDIPELAKLADVIPIPIKESLDEPTAKINILLQSYISRLGLEGYSLTSDMIFITQSAGRLFRALFEIVLYKGWALAERVLDTCKSVEQRMWIVENPLRQFKSDISLDIIRRLEKMSSFSWQDLLVASSQEIGELVKLPKIGSSLYSYVHKVPKLQVEGFIQTITNSILRVELTITPDFQYDMLYHGASLLFWILVTDVNSEYLLHYEQLLVQKKNAVDPISVHFTVSIEKPLQPHYYVRVISDRWVGSLGYCSLPLMDILLPKLFNPPTQLVDLIRTRVQDLQDYNIPVAYIKSLQFDALNSIQTQVLDKLLNDKDNFVLASPTGSGKLTLVELVIHKYLMENTRCVYLVPHKDAAKSVWSRWITIFNTDIILLDNPQGGEQVSLNIKAYLQARLIITIPVVFDLITRKRKAKLTKDIGLLVVDDIHMTSSEPCLEISISRVRRLSSLSLPIRIISLSSSIANASDIAIWTGCSQESTFSFFPSVRPKHLNLHVVGFHQHHPEYRQTAMLKPVFNTILLHPKGYSCIVHVSSKKQVRATSLGLLELATSYPQDTMWITVPPLDIQDHVQVVMDPILKITLVHGVGFLHSGLLDQDTVIVQHLYSQGIIKILVMEHCILWRTTLRASMTIIQGTVYYEHGEARYEDYPLNNVTEMVGKADHEAYVFCHVSKTTFFNRFLIEPAPVESHINHFLMEPICAEVASGIITTLQDVVDYMTWTFYFNRLESNPNYYGLVGTSPQHISDHLSELCETIIEDLHSASCITINEETISPLNMGLLCTYYNLKFESIQLLNDTLSSSMGLKDMLNLLCSFPEFGDIVVRQYEDRTQSQLTLKCRLKPSFKATEEDLETTIHIRNKIHLLLQAHFGRVELDSALLIKDQQQVLSRCINLIQAIVDAVSSNGYLHPAIAAMELSQMIVQGVWNDNENQLYQLPHMNPDIISSFVQADVLDIPSFLDLDPDDRMQLLKTLTKEQVQDIARVCNEFPDVSVDYQVSPINVRSGELVQVRVLLDQEQDAQEVVYAPRYPLSKMASWWLLLGSVSTNAVYAIKRISLRTSQETVLEFTAPEPGAHSLSLYFI